MDEIKTDINLGDSQIQRTINENAGLENVAIEEKKKGSAGSRDLQVSALVHLLGLPTKDELKVLEKKVDLLSNKLTSMAGKLDRVLSEISQAEIIGAIERAELQVADLKAILKKVLPKVASSFDSGEHAILDETSQTRMPKVSK